MLSHRAHGPSSATALPEDLADTTGKVFHHGWGDVAVDVHGEGGRRVAKDFADDFDGHVVLQSEGGVRVAAVVESDAAKA